ncbi:trigger factor [Eisenbergiella sp. OF01-20]|jgi:trigger factor|nr:trigger factor [Eisenbergiella sp. OF01-20]
MTDGAGCAIVNDKRRQIMKKFITTITVLALSASVLAGCGKSADSGESTQAATESSTETGTQAETGTETVEYGDDAYVDGINVGDYVTLGEYKGIEVTAEAPAVTDEYLQSYIDYVLQSNMVTTDITDRAVQNGDFTNIDYEGKIDGVAFDGGTAQGYDLEIGSGSFIPGFEDGLIGAAIGETRDVTVTFPESYPSEEVAGKEAVFTVTVNSIHTETIPELTDELVKGLEGNCSTVDEYRQYAYELLMEDEQSTHDSNAQMDILAKVVENSEFKEPPAEMVTRYYDRIKSNMSSYAAMYGYDLESFMAATGSSEEQLQESAEQASREIIAMKAIADAENLNVTDEDMDEELAKNAGDYGYEDVEEYKKALDLKGYKEYMMTEKVLSFLFDNAVITDTQPEETAAQETSAEETAQADETETGTAAETASETQTETK